MEMSKKEISSVHQSTFESLKKINQQGQDYWSARELSKVLGYQEYRNFLPVIEKAKEACRNSQQEADNHFVDIHEMVAIGSGASREMPTVALSRYACYLIVQNADPSKPIVALKNRGRGLNCETGSLVPVSPDSPFPESRIPA